MPNSPYKPVTLLPFNESDLEAFARFSGDFNPLHLDAQYARRTSYRAPVVHGVLVFLRGIQAAFPTQVKILEADLQFRASVGLGESVQIQWDREPEGAHHHLRFLVGRQTVALAKLTLSEPSSISGFSPTLDPGESFKARPARDIPFAEIAEGYTQSLNFSPRSDLLRPALGLAPGESIHLDRESVSFFSQCSTFIGMEMPGRSALLMSIGYRAGKSESQAFSGFEYQFKIHRKSDGTRSLMIHVGESVSKSQGTVTSKVLHPLLETTTDPDSPVSTALKGKVALITGGSRGIGAATAKLLALNGCTVAIQYHRGKDDAEGVADWIRTRGGEAKIYSADLTRAEEATELARSFKADFKNLDVLVHSAFTGTRKEDRFSEVTTDHYHAQFQIGAFAAHHLVQAFDLELRASHARVIGLSSSYALHLKKGFISYIVGKYALEGLFKALSCEYESVGVKFSLLFPSEVLTDLNATRYLDGAEPDLHFWRPSEVAARVLRCVLDPKPEFSIPVLK